jgi:hypothetical protein
MNDLAAVDRVLVHRSLVDDMQARLRAIGDHGFEAFALWVGVVDGTKFRVERIFIPEQHAAKGPEGVHVRVDGDELHRINVWLHEKGLRLFAQIHTHPTDAFHSDTDDSYAIATTTGCLSIVVPDFARDSFAVERCAMFRLDEHGDWLPLAPHAARALVLLED